MVLIFIKEVNGIQWVREGVWGGGGGTTRGTFSFQTGRERRVGPPVPLLPRHNKFPVTVKGEVVLRNS